MQARRINMLLVDFHLMNMDIKVKNLKKQLKVQRARAERKKTLKQQINFAME